MDREFLRNKLKFTIVKRFFRPKSGGLQKKKKKVFTEIETDVSAKIGNSYAFSGRIKNRP